MLAFVPPFSGFFALFVIVTAFSIGVPEIDHQKTDSTDMTTKDRRPRL